MIANKLNTHPILLFDGVCNLCNSTVQWIIKRDPKGIIHFASLQSDFAKGILEKLGLKNLEMNSVILVVDNTYYTKSDAISQVLKSIRPHSFLNTLINIFPKFLRDWGYERVARNRYRIFGKRDSCMLPQPGWKERFPEQNQV